MFVLFILTFQKDLNLNRCLNIFLFVIVHYHMPHLHVAKVTLLTYVLFIPARGTCHVSLK